MGHGAFGLQKYGLGWKYMPRWQRKQFHRENESRVRRGLKPLPKPESKELITHGV